MNPKISQVSVDFSARAFLGNEAIAHKTALNGSAHRSAAEVKAAQSRIFNEALRAHARLRLASHPTVELELPVGHPWPWTHGELEWLVNSQMGSHYIKSHGDSWWALYLMIFMILMMVGSPGGVICLNMFELR